MAVTIDELDRKILVALQEDATQSLDDLAQKLAASKTPVWNRIKKLRTAGVISRQVAIVDPNKVDRSSCFFVLVRTSQHDSDWLARFQSAIKDLPEVLEAHRLAGDIDYILKVRVKDAKDYDGFYQRLVEKVSIFNVTSLLSMEEMKMTTALPL